MQRKGQNKRSITRCFLCMNLYAQQIKVRSSLSTDSCTMLAGKSTVFSTSPITIATVHEIHLQLVFSVVIVALYYLFCKLFFLFVSLCFMVLFRKASLVHDTQFSIYLRPVSNRCSPFLGSFKGGQIQCL